MKGVGALGELVSVQLRRVDIILTRGFITIAEEMGLRSGMIGCLGLIVANPGISQKEISEQTGRDKSIIASLMNDLEDRGWIRRARSANDHRSYELAATAEGAQRLEAIASEIRTMEERLLQHVSTEELATLSRILDVMHKSCRTTLKNSA